MTEPNVGSAQVVPTSQRPLNGALAGAGALAGWYLARRYGVPEELAPVLGLAISAGQATLGDWARGMLAELPPGVAWGVARLPLLLAARLG